MPLLHVLKTGDVVIMEGSELQCCNNFEKCVFKCISDIYSDYNDDNELGNNSTVIIIITMMMRNIYAVFD